MIDPRDQCPDGLLALARDLSVDDRAVRRLLTAILGRGLHDPAEWGRSFQVPDGSRMRSETSPACPSIGS